MSQDTNGNITPIPGFMEIRNYTAVSGLFIVLVFVCVQLLLAADGASSGCVCEPYSRSLSLLVLQN